MTPEMLSKTRLRPLWVGVTIFLFAIFAPVTVMAQMGGQGNGYGMMGGAYGSWQGAQQITLSVASRLLAETSKQARIDTGKNEVVFRGDHIKIAMAAVQPGFRDTTFEVAGLVDPTIVVPTGSEITLTFFNMDYGYQMDHGVVVTPVPPPYPVLNMMGMPYSVVGIPILAPRTARDEKTALYPEDSITFVAPQPGTYYYLCQYYDHASKGMYGRFIVANN